MPSCMHLGFTLENEMAIPPLFLQLLLLSWRFHEENQCTACQKKSAQRYQLFILTDIQMQKRVDDVE